MRRQIFHSLRKIFSEAKRPRGGCAPCLHVESQSCSAVRVTSELRVCAAFAARSAGEWRTRHDRRVRARKLDCRWLAAALYMLPSTLFTNVLMVVPVVS